MTIGPEPMIKIFFMSVRLGIGLSCHSDPPEAGKNLVAATFRLRCSSQAKACGYYYKALQNLAS